MAHDVFEIPDANTLFDGVTFFGRNDSNGCDYVQLHDVSGEVFEMSVETLVKALHAYNYQCFRSVIRAYNCASVAANDTQHAIDHGADGATIAAAAHMCGVYTRFIMECMDDFFEVVDNHEVANATVRLFEFRNGLEFYAFDVNRTDIAW